MPRSLLLLGDDGDIVGRELHDGGLLWYWQERLLLLLVEGRCTGVGNKRKHAPDGGDGSQLTKALRTVANMKAATADVMEGFSVQCRSNRPGQFFSSTNASHVSDGNKFRCKKDSSAWRSAMLLQASPLFYGVYYMLSGGKEEQLPRGYQEGALHFWYWGVTRAYAAVAASRTSNDSSFGGRCGSALVAARRYDAAVRAAREAKVATTSLESERTENEHTFHIPTSVVLSSLPLNFDDTDDLWLSTRQPMKQTGKRVGVSKRKRPHRKRRRRRLVVNEDEFDIYDDVDVANEESTECARKNKDDEVPKASAEGNGSNRDKEHASYQSMVRGRSMLLLYQGILSLRAVVTLYLRYRGKIQPCAANFDDWESLVEAAVQWAACTQASDTSLTEKVKHNKSTSRSKLLESWQAYRFSAQKKDEPHAVLEKESEHCSGSTTASPSRKRRAPIGISLSSMKTPGEGLLLKRLDLLLSTANDDFMAALYDAGGSYAPAAAPVRLWLSLVKAG